MSRYVGRFAPSPTGALHAGSLVTALASWLDAKAHGGKWLIRIEDIDGPRCIQGADQEILRQLAACGLIADEPPVYQSRRGALYQSAMDILERTGLLYPCACSRKDIEQAHAAIGAAKKRHGQLVYPGTCRSGLAGRPARAWRFNTHGMQASSVVWYDRRLRAQQQHVAEEVGDFVLRRADGLWAYQLAVVVDDMHQGVTHVVRGEDLADNTARQILLQTALGCPTPSYLHAPLVFAADGQKLSKQNGAEPLALGDHLQAYGAVEQAARCLGLQPTHQRPANAAALLSALEWQWREKYCAGA